MVSIDQVSKELMGKKKEEPIYQMRISKFATNYQTSLEIRFLLHWVFNSFG